MFLKFPAYKTHPLALLLWIAIFVFITYIFGDGCVKKAPQNTSWHWEKRNKTIFCFRHYLFVVCSCGQISLLCWLSHEEKRNSIFTEHKYLRVNKNEWHAGRQQQWRNFEFYILCKCHILTRRHKGRAYLQDWLTVFVFHRYFCFSFFLKVEKNKANL